MSTRRNKITIKPPPIFNDAESALQDYLVKLENLPIHQWERTQRVWKRDIRFDLFEDGDIESNILLLPEREPNTGKQIGWEEVILDEEEDFSELSMRRPPLPPHLAARGSSFQPPFWPAGFQQEIQVLEKKIEDQFNRQYPIHDLPGKFLGEEFLTSDSEIGEDLLFSEDGFTRLKLPNENNDPSQHKFNFHLILQSDTDNNQDIKETNISELFSQDNRLKGLWTDNDDSEGNGKDSTKTEETSINSAKAADSSSQGDDYSFLDQCVIKPAKPLPEVPILNITSTIPKLSKMSTEWAEMIDVTQPVEDFEKKVPQMAHKYPFELDTFQKQAILKLEEQAHVFVAAHTSAGKTVVAEYAIALSQRHCTRTIYTSPIKALSNQKYHDFRKTFSDVGLLTGDLQINASAACLVMTTEILRSMLYCGSDVTRDLEFVIFDEVHYINNTERGHVWEEVLILLPAQVGIVMLSATVPNTLEFADWLGRTKQRKVYVISTPKRPVPLCHYLYTGSGGKSKNERFMVIDQDGNFSLRGYNEAVAAKAARQSDYKKSVGPKGGRIFLNPKQEQTMWVAFIDHLKTNDKLPVVAFTLSRNRCDQNAQALMSVDLTTAKEKSRIHSFFQRCLQRLKEPDRKLPQVVRLQQVLSQGVGVHHSGILPMLKEIVEILFQAGLVKILFATETFAMGVNMPARTVVFDETKKFDGVERRTLAPAEYIQMAGRAGRRGLDKTGTVVILCKENVPDMMELREMMLGQPTRLSSQFRLTYAMILSLLRVETVSVEGMMQRSFREFGSQCRADLHRQQLKEAEQRYADKCNEPLAPHLGALATFYDVATKYIQELSNVMPILLEQPKIVKELVPGKVLVISVGPYINQLAILLNMKGPRLTPFKVLVLDVVKHKKEVVNLPIEKTEEWYRVLSLSIHYENIGTDTPMDDHTIICIAAKNILNLTKLTLKIDTDTVMQDFEKRQIPRFRDAPVGKKCSEAVRELSRLSHAAYTKATNLEYISLTQTLAVKSGEILSALDRMSNLKEELESIKSSTDIANFEREFAVVFDRKQTELTRDRLRRLLSYESMALYPDYMKRLEVLKELSYIDEEHKVIIKGRVACEMGTNELIISELVFRNTLTELEPAEIAALLSCLVFQAKTVVEHELNDRLTKGILAIKDVQQDIVNVERKYAVEQYEGLGMDCTLNFGLVKVVYEWAQDKPFAQIMDLTDVQEGIIVRCIQQLHEVLLDVKDAAKIIGDPTLFAKMEEATTAVKRDIVFAASLYTTQKENISIDS